MGSVISLSVGRLEIDWGKNVNFADHSPLFQPSDLAQVPYYYVDEDDPCDGEGEYNLVTVMKEGLSKPLEQVIDRVALLGFTVRQARREFEFLSRFHDLNPAKFCFEQLATALSTVDVTSGSADYGADDDFGELFRRYLFDRLGLEETVGDPGYVRYAASEAMENLSPYAVLNLVAQNPSACGLSVSWRFADLEEGGWADRTEFLKTVDRRSRFLVVTEGSSDGKAIEHALKLLKPHVADFFSFVDMKEGYPFTGTGNLFNFAKGLVSISVQNSVVILYDNDAEGVWSCRRTRDLNLPDNMRVLRLPDLADFRNFRTVGPTGAHSADINGRAAAIECYLDPGPAAEVRWSHFHKGLRVYHGALVGKERVLREFLRQTEVSQAYDFRRIASVVEMIISECVAMREAAQLQRLDLA